MASPYPLYYTLSWLYYHLKPEIKNYTNLARYPMSYQFNSLKEEPVYRVFFLGDIMCMQHDRIPKIDPALRNLLDRADLVIGSCEAPITHQSVRPNATYLFDFNMAEDFLYILLKELGIHCQCVLSIANNHIGDRNEEGFYATLERFKNIGITPVGNIQIGNPPIVKIVLGDITIGIAAWTHWLNRKSFEKIHKIWRTPEIRKQSWVNVKEYEKIDCLIGTPHWEYEFQHFPNSETRDFAHYLLESGFNLLVGHHPHVIQPLEWYNNGICLYSVGNFCGFQLSWPTKLVGIFEVRICASGSHRGLITGYTLHPYVQLETKDEVAIVPLENSPSALRQKFEDRLALMFEK